MEYYAEIKALNIGKKEKKIKYYIRFYIKLNGKYY